MLPALSTTYTGEDLATDATDVGHEQQDKQKCKSLLCIIKIFEVELNCVGENLVTNATEMNHEAHGQQDEQRCKSLRVCKP